MSVYLPHIEIRMAEPPKNLICLSSGESGGELTITDDKVLRRLPAAPWTTVRPLLASIAEADRTVGLIPWSEVETNDDWVLLRHPRVRVISYPHEWSAEMLHEAALTHCRLLASVAKRGMALKDAHPWNILFDGTRAVFIDIGSIVPLATLADLDYLQDTHTRSHPALAGDVFKLMFLPYFLLPLAFHRAGLGHIARDMLWRYPLNGAERRPRITDYLRATAPRQWLRAIDGIRLASNVSAGFRALCRDLETSGSLDSFADRLAKLVDEMSPLPARSAYSEYYAAKGEEHPLDQPATWNVKQLAVRAALDRPDIQTVLDIACNTGWYSRLAASLGKQVTAIDIDDACISGLYRGARTSAANIVALVADITRPTPDRQRNQNGGLLLIGSERRLHGDIVLALGILHHLVLGAGIALGDALQKLAGPADRALVLEFVGLDDELVMKEPAFFAALARNPTGFTGFTLSAVKEMLATTGWEVTVVPSFPATRSLLVCLRRNIND